VLFDFFRLKLSCDSRFQRAFTARSCILKVITLVWANQRNFFENLSACNKRMPKTLVTTQLIDCSADFLRRIFLQIGECDYTKTAFHRNALLPQPICACSLFTTKNVKGPCLPWDISPSPLKGYLSHYKKVKHPPVLNFPCPLHSVSRILAS